MQRKCSVKVRGAEENALPMKGQIRRNLYFNERVRCLWKFSKKLIFENTRMYAKGTAVNGPTEEAKYLEKIYLDWEVLFHCKFSMHFSLAAIT